MTPRKKLILAASAFIGLSVLLAAYATYRAFVYTATIEIKFAPESAKVTLNGNGASAGKNQVAPGKYQVRIVREGFAEYTTEVEAKKGETTLVQAVLDSNDPSTANWYQQNTSDYGIAQSIGDGIADRQYDEIVKKLPIFKDLPMNGLYGSYEVFYEIANNSRGYELVISYQTEASKQEAIHQIKTKGYKLEDYDVVYRAKTITVNNVVISGSIALSNAGYDKTVVDLITDNLTRTYITYADEKVTSVEFLDDLTQTIHDNDDTSTISFTFNNQYTRRLTIHRSGQDSYAITVSAPDGSESTSIY